MYTNHNISLYQLQDMIKENFSKKFDYLPETFNKEQQYALEIFTKRIFLESVIEESIDFNKKLIWDYEKQHVSLVKNAEELLEVFKLRSDVFHEINYQDEFKDNIEGLNFDQYDKNSAIVIHKVGKEITATIRLIFDSVNKLPSEKNFPFDDIRLEHGKIGEISRNIVKYRDKGLNQEFKYLMCGIYNIFKNNQIDIALSGIKAEHLKLFKKLGGVDIYKNLDGYGSFKTPCLIISYDPKGASSFFKKVFLEEK